MTKDENPKAEEGGEFARALGDGIWFGNMGISLEFDAETIARRINTAFRLAAREIEEKAYERAIQEIDKWPTLAGTQLNAIFKSIKDELRKLAQEARKP